MGIPSQGDIVQEPSHSPHSGWTTPLPGHLLGLAHGIWALALAAELGSQWAVVRSSLPFHVFALLGCVLLGAGTVFFLALRGLGWVLLFLGNCSLVLHFLQGVFRSGLSLDVGTFGAALISVGLLVALSLPRMMRIFSGHAQRLWTRSPRFRAHFALRVRHHRHLSEAELVDVSRTGCSFLSSSRIPLGELVEVESEGVIFPPAQTVWRKEVEEAYRYGVRFRGTLPTALLISISSKLHLREEGPGHRFQRK